MRSLLARLSPARVAFFALLTVSCTGGEGPTVVPVGALIAVNATFPAGMTAQQFAQANFDRAEVIIERSERTVAQQSIALPEGFGQTVDVEVVLEGETEDLAVVLEIWSGSLLAYYGAIGVTAIAGQTVSTDVFTLEPQAPVLSISTGSGPLIFTEVPGTGLLQPLSFDISNSGRGTLSWVASSTAPWLTVVPTSGDVEPDASQTIQLNGSRSGLAPGTHTASVEVTGEGIVGAPVSIAVSVVVQAERQLNVSGAGSGSGNVSSTPAGIACSVTAGVAAGACSSLYPDGASVTLAAAANQGSNFTGWAGAGCSGAGVCQVAMSQAQSVTATFTLQPSPPPAAPSNLQIVSAAPKAVTLTWVDNSRTETSFVVERGSLRTAWVQAGAVATDVTRFVDTNNNIFGEPVFYRVAALNAAGRSGNSNPDSVTIPPPSQAPSISGITQQLLTLNDTASCAFQTPVGSLFLVQFDYSDPDGDINLGTSVVQNDWAFNPQRTGSFSQPPDGGLDFSGNGLSGTAFSLQCHTFVNDQLVDVTVTLYDDAGNPSNQLTVRIDRPSGANAPAASPPAGGGGAAIRSGGPRPNPPTP